MPGEFFAPDTQPLLEHVNVSDDNVPNLDATERAHFPRECEPTPEVRWLSVSSLAVIIIFYLFANYLLVVPTLRLFESAICRDYYGETNDVDESLCKIGPIQARLANLLGWRMAFEAIPGSGVCHTSSKSFL